MIFSILRSAWMYNFSPLFGGNAFGAEKFPNGFVMSDWTDAAGCAVDGWNISSRSGWAEVVGGAGAAATSLANGFAELIVFFWSSNCLKRSCSSSIYLCRSASPRAGWGWENVNPPANCCWAACCWDGGGAFPPSRWMRWASSASKRLAGARVKSGISPRSIPTDSATRRNSATLSRRVRNDWN